MCATKPSSKRAPTGAAFSKQFPRALGKQRPKRPTLLEQTGHRGAKARMGHPAWAPQVLAVREKGGTRHCSGSAPHAAPSASNLLVAGAQALARPQRHDPSPRAKQAVPCNMHAGSWRQCLLCSAHQHRNAEHSGLEWGNCTIRRWVRIGDNLFRAAGSPRAGWYGQLPQYRQSIASTRDQKTLTALPRRRAVRSKQCRASRLARAPS